MWISTSTFTWISLFCQQQTVTVFFIFHVPCTVLFTEYFHTVISLFLTSIYAVFVIDRTGKQTMLIKLFDFFLTKDEPSISQSNVQAVKAENEEQYTLSNMIYIKFPNCCFFFFEVYFGAPKMHTNQLNNVCNGVDIFVCILTKICFSTSTFQDFWSNLFCSYL